MTRTPRKVQHATVGALLVALAACSSATTDSGAGSIKAVVLPYLSMAPLHVAAAEGYFEDENLDVEFMTLQRHQDHRTALVRGEVDVAAGMISVNELALAAQGEPMRIVAGLGQLVPGECSFAAVVARTEHVESGAITDPDRIRQMKFDADVLIPFGFWLDVLLEPQGLTVDDLDMVNLPSTASVPALIAGQIDVTIESEPFLSTLLAADEATLWEETEQLVPGFMVSVVLYGPTLLNERRDDGVRFASALVRGIRQYDQGKTPRNREIVQGFSGLPAPRIAEACWPTASENGRMDPALLRDYQEWVVKRGYVDRVVEDDELFDPSFIEEALASVDNR